MEDEEKPRKEETAERETGPSHLGGVEQIRGEVEELIRGVFSDEGKQHMIRAGSELLLAIDAMVPYSKIPQEARQHHLQMKKEFLLMAKSLIDANLGVIERAGSGGRVGPRKIDID
jgi:hypothetical protein